LAKKNPNPGGNNLLIVESPAKAKTIKKFLGGSFTIKASLGHVRDIPSKGRGKKALGIDIDNGFLPTYEPIKGREKVLDELKDAAEKADTIYLAPDPDREGEAIAWHLKEALHLPADKTCRVTFNAITKRAIQDAIANPSEINMNLVNAQQGRRVLDRLVGYSLSPFLWKKITKGLSGGRVQSVAVRLVVDREREIMAFTPEEFWRIAALVSKTEGDKSPFIARLVKWKGEKFALGNDTACREESVKAIAEALEKEKYAVTAIDERKVKGRPSPPFITSTLQQAASTWLRYSTDRTMRIAQQLYEGVALDGGEMTGLITYMRTDSTRIAPEALTETRNFIEQHYAPEYLPEKAQVYSSKNNAQDAHEAVRPTSVLHTPERVKPFLTADQFKLYDLIWRRFVASQMSPAEYLTTTATIEAGNGVFEAKGRQVKFDGHTILSMEAQKKAKKDSKSKSDDDNDTDEETGSEESDKDQILPRLSEKEPLNLNELTPSQHFTQPPPRYSEASLVRTLEKEGIGRPSTYAPIVKTIQDRGYVRLDRRRFYATELGIAVTDLLVQNFEGIMDLKFTAGMEADLDHVEEGNEDWVKLIEKFYGPFSEKVEYAVKNAASLKGRPAPGGEKCPLCGGDMVVRYSRSGAFLGCANYPECKGLIAMPGENASSGEDGEEGELISCPQCGAPMIRKRSRYGDFLACSGYPACKQTLPLGKDGKPVELPDIKMDCDKCGKPMVVKMGRRGPFLACSGYPDCKNTKHLDREGKIIELPVVEGEVCEKCGAEMIVRMSRRGPFLACSAFPKCRNAKNIPGLEKKKKADGDESDEGGDGEDSESGAKTVKKKTAKKTTKKAAKKTTKKATAKKSTASDEAEENESES